MKTKLELAIAFQTTAIGSASSIIEAQLGEALKKVEAHPDRVARAVALLEMISSFARPQVRASVVNGFGALEVLKEMWQQAETDPSKELSYEFYCGHNGDDYADGRDVSQPIDESELTGVTMELVRTLRLAEIEIAWAARTNGLKARFVIKAD